MSSLAGIGTEVHRLIEEYFHEKDESVPEWLHAVHFGCQNRGDRPLIAICGEDVTDSMELEGDTSEYPHCPPCWEDYSICARCGQLLRSY